MCNTGLGHFRDDPGVMRAAATYLLATCWRVPDGYDVVPGDGVEPPTRGFSTQQASTHIAEGSGPFSQALSGNCTASGPDDALKSAICAAVNGGLYDRARALLDVLAKTSEPAAVVDLRDRARR